MSRGHRRGHHEPIEETLALLALGEANEAFDGYGGVQIHYMCESMNPGLLGTKNLVPPFYSLQMVQPFGPSIAGVRALKPGSLTMLHVEHFGNAGNPVGSTVLYQLEYGGAPVPGSQITLAADVPTTQSETVTFPPFPYNPSDVMRLTATPSTALSAPVIEILAEAG